MKGFASVISTVLALSVAAKAQNVVINCAFLFVTQFDYSCDVIGVNIADNENLPITIAGQHLQGQNNAAVRVVRIFDSNVPFIITQFFTTFVNLERLEMGATGTNRIQPNAFVNAGSLRTLQISQSPQLREIIANAFAGAWNLELLQIFQSGVESISELAFSGLSRLTNLNLARNRISQLPVNVFTPLTALQMIFLWENQLTVLNGSLFEANTMLLNIDVSDNQINAIGRSFVDTLTNLRFLDMVGNHCISRFFAIGNGDQETTVIALRQALETCFINSGEPPSETKTFVLELLGSLIIRHVNGTEIIRMQG